MKAIYFLKSMLLTAFVFIFATVGATEFQVSGTGANLANALNQAVDGDVIKITGTIVMSSPVTIEKNITIEGVGVDAVIDGKNATKLIEINPEVVADKFLYVKNLGFIGGNNTADDGGVGRIIGGVVKFENCYFEENFTGKRGGAFFLANDGTDALFYNCSISVNKANERGGAFFVAGDVNLVLEYCTVEENNSFGDRGGAFFIEGGTTRVFHSKINLNTSGDELAPGGEKGGAAFTTAGACKALTVEASAITNNVAFGNHGSAFFIMGGPNVTVINTTIAKNQNNGAGSFFLPGDIDLTLANVTMVQNFTAGNPGNSSGIRVMNVGNKIHVYNSIIVGNENSEGATDFMFNDNAGIETTMDFRNSIIGYLGGLPLARTPVAKDNANIANKSKINEYKLEEGNAQPAWSTMDESGINFEDGMQLSSPSKMGYYTLTSATAYAAGLGDFALLKDKDVTTDQFLSERTETNKAIWAGAVQGLVGVVEVTDPVIPPFIPTSIDAISKNVDQITLNTLVAKDGLLTVNFGNLTGSARGDLYSVNGQLVKNIFNRQVTGSGVYPIDGVASGFYILKITIAGKVYAKRLIVQ